VTVDSADLERLWSVLEQQPVVAAFRSVSIGARTPPGELQVAVDAQGHRHLLVPLAAGHSLKEAVDGEAVVLRRRALEDERRYQQYASLELMDERLQDLFTALCVEVTDRINAAPDRAVAALRDVLKDWRALLAGARPLLTSSALAGLFGELHFLQSLIAVDPGAVAFWTGPTGSAQDFHRGSRAVELKTTTAPEGRTVHVHGVDQLDVSTEGGLVLLWLRVQSQQGISVPDLVDDILALTDDTTTFRVLLRKVGYDERDREVYARRVFDVIESRTYQVGRGFPRITTAGLTGDAALSGVGPIDYTVDLDAPPALAHHTHVEPTRFLLGHA